MLIGRVLQIGFMMFRRRTLRFSLFQQTRYNDIIPFGEGPFSQRAIRCRRQRRFIIRSTNSGSYVNNGSVLRGFGIHFELQ